MGGAGRSRKPAGAGAERVIKELYAKYVMTTYGRDPLVVDRAKGVYVWDVSGRRYLDFFAGWGVSALGYCHPSVVDAVKKQASRLIHVSNNFYHESQGRLAQALIRSSFPGKVFFANSGAEVNETAIKIARRFGSPDRYEIITMKGSFHGRTAGALAATGQQKHQHGFGPLLPGFLHVPLNDVEAVRQAVTEKTVAIMLEPIQGEGGIHVAGDAYLAELRALCDRHNLLLIFDEVQSGLGRSGTMYAYQHSGVVPDMMTLAKALGNGLGIGAVIAGSRCADVLGAGTHGSTYGGAALACAGSLAVLEAIKRDRLLAKARKMGRLLESGLQRLAGSHPKVVRQVRGRGLMLGVELHVPGAPLVAACRDRGLLVNCTQDRVLRLLPPMIVEERQIHEALTILDEVMASCGS